MKEIPLTQGKVAIVDDVDYEWLSQWNWHCHRDCYACYARRSIRAGSRWTTIYMHRSILNAPPRKQVDHINGDGLDNRRSNLRLCDQGQNQMNRGKMPGSSQYKGVTWHRHQRKWNARIKVGKKPIHLGSFEHEIEAARAYNIAAIRYHGEFARLNAV